MARWACGRWAFAASLVFVGCGHGASAPPVTPAADEDARIAERFGIVLGDAVRANEAYEAGVHAEFMLAYAARPGRVIDGPTLTKLDPVKFRAWAAEHVRQRPTSLVEATGNPRGVAGVPGEGLPDPAGYDLQRVPCEDTSAAIAAAMRAWEAEVDRLAPIPVSAETGEELLAALDVVRRRPDAASRGAIWASPRVLALYYHAGFCAVERKDAAAAEAVLRAGIAFSPGCVPMRSELAHVYVSTGRPREVLAVVEEAMPLASGRCDRALLLRRKGYAFFDLGLFTDSYLAYSKSLELDPGNPIATGELKLIVAELKRRGTATPPEAGTFQPPPPGGTTVTKCRRE